MNVVYVRNAHLAFRRLFRMLHATTYYMYSVYVTTARLNTTNISSGLVGPWCFSSGRAGARVIGVIGVANAGGIPVAVKVVGLPVRRRQVRHRDRRGRGCRGRGDRDLGDEVAPVILPHVLSVRTGRAQGPDRVGDGDVGGIGRLHEGSLHRGRLHRGRLHGVRLHGGRRYRVG